MSDSTDAEERELFRALESWPDIEILEVKHLTGGLINRSWAVRGAECDYVAQRVNPIFSSGVNRNIQRISEHLRERGPQVPRLLQSEGGELFVDLAGGGRWRLMERLPGFSFDRCPGEASATSAALLVARFHSEAASWRGELEAIGFPFHETPRYFLELRRVVEKYSEHPLRSDVATLANEIFEASENWTDLSGLPRRLVHGDLKYSNLLFEGSAGPASERASALIDLDTLSHLPLYFDLGDAWRSWCNVGGEDVAEPDLDLRIFYASAESYLSELRLDLSRPEIESLTQALERVSLELCARYATDALAESYFGWNPDLFDSLGDHNWARARGQWRLYVQARETHNERARFLLS